MRRMTDEQLYMPWYSEATLKVVREAREEYEGISRVLDGNPEILKRVHRDLSVLSEDETEEGREATYTSENY